MVNLRSYNKYWEAFLMFPSSFSSSFKQNQIHPPILIFKNKPTYYSIDNKWVINIHVVLEGFEPSQAEPESDVLPLHHRTIFYCAAKVRIYFSITKPYRYFFTFD